MNNVMPLEDARALIRRESGASGPIDFSFLYPEYARDNGVPSARAPKAIPAIVFVEKITELSKDRPEQAEFCVKGALVEGSIHLEQSKFDAYLRFENCRFRGRVDLRHSAWKRLKFVNCTFEKVLEADVCTVEGDVHFDRCNAMNGMVFTAADIGGRFVIDKTKICGIHGMAGEPAQGRAFGGNMLVVRSGLFFRRRSRLYGSADLSGARVDGNVEFRGSIICSWSGASIIMSNSHVHGKILIEDRCRLTGYVDIFSVRCDLFSIKNSVISSSSENGIDAEAARVSTYFTVGEGLDASGICLASASIDGALHIGNGSENEGEKRHLRGMIDLRHSTINKIHIDMRYLKSRSMVFNLGGCVFRGICDPLGRTLSSDDIQTWMKFLSRSDGKDKPWIEVIHKVSHIMRDEGRHKEFIIFDKIYRKYNHGIIVNKLWGCGMGYGHNGPSKVLAVAGFTVLVFSLLYSFLVQNDLMVKKPMAVGGAVTTYSMSCPQDGVSENIRNLYHCGWWDNFGEAFSYSLDMSLPFKVNGGVSYELSERGGYGFLIRLAQQVQALLAWVFFGLLVAWFAVSVWRPR